MSQKYPVCSLNYVIIMTTRVIVMKRETFPARRFFNFVNKTVAWYELSAVQKLGQTSHLNIRSNFYVRMAITHDRQTILAPIFLAVCFVSSNVDFSRSHHNQQRLWCQFKEDSQLVATFCLRTWLSWFSYVDSDDLNFFIDNEFVRCHHISYHLVSCVVSILLD